MPRIKYPPTPSTSTGPVAQDKQTDMEGTFALPPAAINRRSPPTSPVIQRKRTLSGSTKNKEELPPPPSRARKIIQMKPKEDAQSAPATGTAGTTSTKPTSPTSKRKQPSATSAAGRKIARKTAHSIIERRRRSKMNEEFGVLKDMIPACKGVEMHKLAILQAGIEYVKYLQGCVDKLQGDRKGMPILEPLPTPRLAVEDEESEDDEDMEETFGEATTPSASPRQAPNHSEFEYRRASTTTPASASTNASPALRPNTSSSSLASQRQLPPLVSKTYSTSPPPITAQTPLQTGISPAFNAIHFNPDLSRTYSNQLGCLSPNILPLPKAAMPMGAPPPGFSPSIGAGQHIQEGHAEATATAALMMLTNDRRSMADRGGVERVKGGGMSVRDLLSH
ncbi:hypothetical protein LTR64_006589 [Lithohypha guttulata]|uniref:BHLH domain-containing protein n=1 Tax=Lithohypha guttulata TaxID=1690604 RepID=A0AAN7T7T5_9EURO|nr:hypothetical protein LTR51_004853 [Lithohypha guttulata]KAK5091462.1 hypothetical protein LTR05_001645 [Lithohypha guttulata]